MSWFARHPAHQAPRFRPVVINDLPTPSRVRIDTAAQTFRTITTASGRAEFPSIPIEATQASLFITKVDDEQAGAPGYLWYGETITIPPSPQNDWWATPIPAAYTRPLPPTWVQLEKLLVPTGLPALVVNGHVFQQADGTPWTAIECTDFRLFQRFLVGEDITPQLAQRQAIGFNQIRVFGMCRNLFDLNPATYPNFYDRLPAFVWRAASFGLRTDFVVFPDCALVMPVLEDQLRHWQRVGDALRSVTSSVLVSLQNEADQTPNHLDTNAFGPLSGLWCSHGSNGSEAPPVSPYFDWTELHTNEASAEWPRKVGHNSMEIWGGPTIATENKRYPDHDNSSVHAFDAAAGAALLCAGSCYHGVDLRQSLVISGDELAGARAWVAGARSVDLRYQHGDYRHAIELETSGVLRAYQRVLPDGSAGTVIIHI